MRRWFAIGTVVILFATLFSCTATVQAQTVPSWTIMVYMDYDNSLDGYILLDTNEIRTGVQGSDGSIQAIVLQDGLNKNGNLLKIEKTGDTTLSLEEYGLATEPNMGSPTTLSTFVNSVISKNPSDNYFLIMGNHGMAFVASMADDTSGDFLTLSELDIAMRSMVGDIDIIGFDCCLMQELAVAHTLSQHCDYIVASEDYEPGAGWDYTFIENLTQSSTSEHVVMSVIDYFDDYYSALSNEPDHTLSALSTSDMRFMVDELSIASQYLASKMGSYQSDVDSALGSSFKITKMIKEMVDMEGFLTLVRNEIGDPNATSYINRVLTALDDTVFYEKSNVPSETGLGIYFPNRDVAISEQYLASSLARDSKYDDWILSYVTNNPVDTLFEIIGAPVISQSNETITCSLPSGFEGGFVEARVDGGDWFTGEKIVTDEEHDLVTRTYFQGTYSDTLGTTIDNVTRIETEVSKTTFSIPLNDGTNFITFPSAFASTANDLLDLVDGDSLTRRTVDGQYKTYVYEVKNDADNFVIEPGKGYFLGTQTDYTLSYEGVPTPVYTNLLNGWNVIGLTRSGSISASDLASEIEGDNIISKRESNGQYITYIEATGAEDFMLSQGDGMYFFSTIAVAQVII